MIFTRSTEYAIRALGELAARWPVGSAMIGDLVRGTGLPRDFTAKIFQRLARKQILRSTRGRGGGFALARPPHKITLMQILEAIEGPQVCDRCVIGLDACNDQMPCAQHDLYKPIRQRLRDYLTTTTLADLAASLKSKQSWKRVLPGKTKDQSFEDSSIHFG